MKPMLSKHSFYLITLTFILLSVLGQISTSIYTPFFKELSWLYRTNINAIEASIGTFLIAFSVSQLLSGITCDYIEKRRFLIVGLLIFIAGTLIVLIADNEVFFILGRVIQGLGGGVGVSVTRALSKQLFSDHQLNISLSLTNIAFGIAPAISPLLGTIIGESLGINAIFHTVLLLALVTLLLLAIAPFTTAKNPGTTSKHTLNETLILIQTGFHHIALIGIASGLLYGIVFCFVTIAPAIIIEQYQQEKTEFSIYSLFATLSFVLGSIMNIKLSSVTAMKKFKVSSFAILLLSLALLMLASLQLQSLFILLGVCYLIFLAIGIAMPCSVSIMLGFSNTSAGFLAALTGFFHLTGASIGAYLVTMLNKNPSLAFAIVITVLSLVSVITSYFLKVK